jgi:hypothetical protein
LKEIVINDRPANVAKLASLAEAVIGRVSFSVASPAVLLANAPAPLTDQVRVMSGHRGSQ